jgi:hypothetical protein
MKYFYYIFTKLVLVRGGPSGAWVDKLWEKKQALGGREL